MEAEITRCFNQDPTDFEGFFKAKVKFNELTGNAQALRISLVQGGKVKELYNKCKRSIERFDKYGSESCSTYNQLGEDVCLYFEVEKFKNEIEEFHKAAREYSYGPEERLATTSLSAIRDYRDYGLKLWKAANTYSLSQLGNSGPRNNIHAALYHLKRFLDEHASGANRE